MGQFSGHGCTLWAHLLAAAPCTTCWSPPPRPGSWGLGDHTRGWGRSRSWNWPERTWCHMSRHITWIRVFTPCVMLARPGPCQLHLTRRSLRGQFMIWPRARLSPLHPSHQLHWDLNPHFFRQTWSFKDPKQSYSFQIFLSSVINIKQWL